MTNVFKDNNEWLKLKTGIRQLAIDEVLSRFTKVGSETKVDGSLLTEADTEMQLACENFLTTTWPEYSFLGEESTQAEQISALKSSQGSWVLDPVDGTSNFVSGIPVFSVSLALVVNQEVIIGIVYDPARDEMFAARKGLGAELNEIPLTGKTVKENLKTCIGIVDFKRLPFHLASKLIQESPFASQRSIGSVALDWCWVAAGRGQVYCHGSQNLWDYIAGYLILKEAGGVSCTFDKTDVFAPRVEKRSAIAATTPELFKEWQQYILES